MRGSGLILFLFFLACFFHYSRWIFPDREESLAVVRLQPQLITVAVTDDKGIYRLYQLSDGKRLSDVIKMTEAYSSKTFLLDQFIDDRLLPGESLKLVKLEGDYLRVERSWLPAQNRILLQIPLHPDRMTVRDWESLPGIGLVLAQSIEVERQKNGDFGELKGLKRVKGIGQKKLEAWQGYFEGND